MGSKPAFEVSKVGGTVTLTMNEAAALKLLEFMEDSLNDGVRLDPSLYAIGERISKRIDPDKYFGVRRAA